MLRLGTIGDHPMREHIVYSGEKFWIQTSGRYFQSGRKDAAERLFHRRVWTDHFGPIPAGMEVHHIDGDWRNTVPGNLELREKTEHARHHMVDRIKQNPARQTDLLVLAREGAKLWHASEAGRSWHSEHGRNTWNTRRRVAVKCGRCGKPFEQYKTHKGPGYCSSACQQSVAVRRYFDSQRTCLHCAKSFLANRHAKTRFCSRGCAIRSRSNKPAGRPKVVG